MTIIRRTILVIAAALAGLALIAPVDASGPYGSDGLTVSDSTPAPGRSISLRASGFRPNSTVVVTLDTSPSVRSSTRATGSGKINTRITIPAGVSGDHTIEAFGIAPDGSPRNLSASITISHARHRGARRTSVQAPGAIAAGVALPAVAALIVGTRRRRRS